MATTLARKLGTFRTTARTRGARGVLRAAVNHGLGLPGGRTLHDAAVTLAGARDAFAIRRRHGAPGIALGYFGGIGDELLLSVVFHELRRRGQPDTWVLSEYPDLWRGNPDVQLVVPVTRPLGGWPAIFGWNVVIPRYTRYSRALGRDLAPERHILTLMCEQAGIVGPIERRPYLALSDAERAAGRVRPEQIAIQSSGLDARFAMPTKQWLPERFQAVVDALRDRFDFVQVGSPHDPPLDGVLDLRGRTTLRETAAVLARSLVFVGQVGMLMHLARAVDCRSVVVYGGREPPDATGYTANENLYTALACAPCWRMAGCPYDMECMRAITPADVVAAVGRQVERRREPLRVDEDFIAAPLRHPVRVS